MKFHFNQFELDTERLELKAGTKLVAVEPQVFSLLVFLIENREHVVSRDDIIEAVWQGRIVSDATVSTRINAARRAVGDDGTTQAVIQTLPRRGFRFVAEVSKERHEGEEANAPAPLSNHQTVKFCQTPDGVNIAYATSGSGPCLLKTTSWLNHLEYDWKSPVWRSMLENLSRDHELIRYDQRGNGLSDWDIEGYSLEAMTLDMQTVLDDHGAETYDIFAISQGCAVAVNYAVENPDKVSRLILYGGYTRGVLKIGRAHV